MKINLNPKLSPKARKYIGRIIKQEMQAGRKQIQAIAMAYRKARAKGFAIPKSPRKNKMTRKDLYSAIYKHHLRDGFTRRKSAAEAREEVRRNPYILIDSKDDKILKIWKGSMLKSEPWVEAQRLAAVYGRPINVVAHPYVPAGWKKGTRVSQMFYFGGPYQQVFPDGSTQEGRPGGTRRNPQRIGATLIREGDTIELRHGGQYTIVGPPVKRGNMIEFSTTRGEILPLHKMATVSLIRKSNPGGLLEGIAATAMTTSVLGNLGGRRRNPVENTPRELDYVLRRPDLIRDIKDFYEYGKQSGSAWRGGLDATHDECLEYAKSAALENLGIRLSKSEINQIIGSRTNPEIRPRLHSSIRGHRHPRPRLHWTPPSPVAHLGERSPLKGRLRGTIPRASTSSLAGLRYNPSGSSRTRSKRRGYSTAAKSYIRTYISRHTPKTRSLTPKQRGTLLAKATSLARSKGLISSSSSKTTRTHSRTRSSRRSYTPVSSRSSFRSRRSLSRSSRGRSLRSGSKLVRIYDHAEKIFARGSANSGKSGITKTTAFKHDFTSRPPIYGVMKSGNYHLPAGAVVLKGSKPLFGIWDKSGKKVFGSKE